MIITGTGEEERKEEAERVVYIVVKARVRPCKIGNEFRSSRRSITLIITAAGVEDPKEEAERVVRHGKGSGRSEGMQAS